MSPCQMSSACFSLSVSVRPDHLLSVTELIKFPRDGFHDQLLRLLSLPQTYLLWIIQCDHRHNSLIQTIRCVLSQVQGERSPGVPSRFHSLILPQNLLDALLLSLQRLQFGFSCSRKALPFSIMTYSSACAQLRLSRRMLFSIVCDFDWYYQLLQSFPIRSGHLGLHVTIFVYGNRPWDERVCYSTSTSVYSSHSCRLVSLSHRDLISWQKASHQFSAFQTWMMVERYIPVVLSK